MQDLSTLLATFLIRLKDGLLPRFFIEPLHHWCVIHSFTREEEARTEEQMRTTAARRYRLRYDDKLTIISLEEWDKDLKDAPLNWLNTEAKALHDETEDKEILVAAALLKFMPAANLSLLDYLMTFFNKLISANYNDIMDADIVRMFAFPIIHSDSATLAKIVFLWLLKRWSRLAELIFFRPPEPQQPFAEFYSREAPTFTGSSEEQAANMEESICKRSKSNPQQHHFIALIRKCQVENKARSTSKSCPENFRPRR